MKKIYGIIDTAISNDVQAYAIDGDTGEIIESHFCSSEGWAKSDLGFSESIAESSDSFNSKRKKEYSEKYPKGYELIWIGDWKSNDKITKLLRKKLILGESYSDEFFNHAEKTSNNHESIDFSEDINFEYLLNKYGPEGLYELANKLKDVANDDVHNGMNE